jgi:molybdopterin/thiamine biosynthesis adenylyltransferase
MTIFNHEIEYRGKKVLDSFNKRIIICGCGAIGSNLIDNLVRQGFCNFTIVDFDRVEDTNLSTQIYSYPQIGRLKTAALSDIVYDISHSIVISECTKKLDSRNAKKFLKKADLIVDAFDNTESRQLLKDFGLDNNIATLHAGMFEDYAEVIWNKQYKVPQVTEGMDVCDYPLARNVIMLLTAVLSEEIIKWSTGENLSNWSITLKDLNISKL